MLVLSRKTREKVEVKVFGQTILTIDVLMIAHDRVKLGFDASREVVIVRTEVLDKEKYIRVV